MNSFLAVSRETVGHEGIYMPFQWANCASQCIWDIRAATTTENRQQISLLIRALHCACRTFIRDVICSFKKIVLIKKLSCSEKRKEKCMMEIVWSMWACWMHIVSYGRVVTSSTLTEWAMWTMWLRGFSPQHNLDFTVTGYILIMWIFPIWKAARPNNKCAVKCCSLVQCQILDRLCKYLFVIERVCNHFLNAGHQNLGFK